MRFCLTRARTYLLKLVEGLLQRARHPEQVLEISQKAETALREAVGEFRVPESKKARHTTDRQQLERKARDTQKTNIRHEPQTTNHTARRSAAKESHKRKAKIERERERHVIVGDRMDPRRG